MIKKKNETLTEKIYHSLYSDIFSGVYSKDSIITEKLLMEKYGVSRAPVREALTQLTANLIIVSIPRHGYKLAPPNEQRMLEIARFRSALECSFLASSYSEISESLIDELTRICNDYLNCASGDAMAHWYYNCEFHLKLFSAYGNKYAYSLLENALSIQTMYFFQREHFATIELHLALVEHLSKGAISSAVAVLKADIEDVLFQRPAPQNAVANASA